MDCTLEVYGNPYFELCDKTVLANVSVASFFMHDTQKKIKMASDDEYGNVAKMLIGQAISPVNHFMLSFYMFYSSQRSGELEQAEEKSPTKP